MRTTEERWHLRRDPNLYSLIQLSHPISKTTQANPSDSMISKPNESEEMPSECEVSCSKVHARIKNLYFSILETLYSPSVYPFTIIHYSVNIV
jgi:hypothetical protein